MSIARVHDPLSLALIRRLGDAGGPRADHVAAELDSLIAWVRSSPRCIHRDVSVVGNVGGGTDTLHTFSLPANSLQANGDFLEVWYAGDFAANDNDKTVNASFGGTTYENIPGLDIDGSVGWVITVRIIRLSATTVLVSHIFAANVIFGDSAAPPNMSTATLSGLIIGRNTPIAGLANLNSNATTMAVQGIGVANDDVFQNLSIIQLTQQ